MATTVTPPTTPPTSSTLESEQYSAQAIFTVVFPDGRKKQEVILNQFDLGYEGLVTLQEALTLAVGGAMIGLGKAEVGKKKAEGKIK